MLRLLLLLRNELQSLAVLDDLGHLFGRHVERAQRAAVHFGGARPGHGDRKVVTPPARRTAGQVLADGRGSVEHWASSVVLDEARRAVVSDHDLDTLVIPANV